MTTLDDETHVVALSEDSLASNGARPSSDWLSTDYKVTYAFWKKIVATIYQESSFSE